MDSYLDFDYNLTGKKSVMKEGENEYVLAEDQTEDEDEMGKVIFNFRKMQQCKRSESRSLDADGSNTGAPKRFCRNARCSTKSHRFTKSKRRRAAKKMPERPEK